jgi:chemotaxis protein CheD
MTQLSVGIGELVVGTGDQLLVTIGLGSCVAIALHDAEQGIGALAHILLPHTALTAGPPLPAKVPSTAVPAMLERMQALGASNRINARLVGGASMFASLLPPGSVGLGKRNVQAARAACVGAGLPVVGEVVGGDYGRSVYFDVRSGKIQVRTIRGPDVSL